MSVNDYKLVFKGKNSLGSDIWRFSFEKPAGFTHIPGQFMEYELPHEPVDDRDGRRWFTIAASPTEPDLFLITRIIEGKRSSFKSALNGLTGGSTLTVHGPDGNFILPKEPQKVILIAGGIGVTPFRSMIKNLVDTRGVYPLTLIWGVKTEADLVFDELFREATQKVMGFKYIPVIANGEVSSGRKVGAIADDTIVEAIGEDDEVPFFVSGPEPMVESFKPRLRALGVAEHNIHQDWFPGYTETF